MTTALLIVHLFVTLALIGVVLIQRSEGGGLGVGTSQGMGGFMSGRGTANLLTRTTAVLATLFFVLSMGLALLNRGTTVGNTRSILDAPPGSPATPATPALTPNPTRPPAQAPATTPGTAPAVPAPATPGATPAPPAAVTPAPGGTEPAAPTLPDAPPPAATIPPPATVPAPSTGPSPGPPAAQH